MESLADVALALVVLLLLLWLGVGLRARIAVLRRLFLPVSVVAGTVGLLLGPQVLGRWLDGRLPWAGGLIPDSSYEVWSGLPGLLISVVFACLFLGKPLPRVGEVWRESSPQVLLGYTISFGQYAVGLLLVLLVLTPFFGTNPLAGVLLEISMTGGHGTAAGLGDTFEQLDFAEGRDLALALATVGLVGGVVLGTVFVNIAARSAKVKLQVEDIDVDAPPVPAPEPDDGESSEPSGGVDALSLQLGIVAAAILIGMGLQQVLLLAERHLWVGLTGELMAYVPLFPLAMIGGALLQWVLLRTGRDHWVDRELIRRISGTALDIIIVSALATLSLSAIGAEFWPFVLLALTGLAWTSFCFLVLGPRFIPRHWFARGIGDFGQGSGMVVSGLLLMRMADPGEKSGNLERFGYKQLLFEPMVGGGLVTALALPLTARFGPVAMLAAAIVLTLAVAVVGFWRGRRGGDQNSRSSAAHR